MRLSIMLQYRDWERNGRVGRPALRLQEPLACWPPRWGGMGGGREGWSVQRTEEVACS